MPARRPAKYGAKAGKDRQPIQGRRRASGQKLKMRGRELTAREWGAVLGVSRQRVWQIYLRAIGLCQCGRPPKAGFKRCQRCIDRSNLLKQAAQQRKRMQANSSSRAARAARSPAS